MKMSTKIFYAHLYNPLQRGAICESEDLLALFSAMKL